MMMSGKLYLTVTDVFINQFYICFITDSGQKENQRDILVD